MIKMRSITKIYTTGSLEQIVLNGIDLDIQKGEMTAVMGASGSGKTTLLNIIGLLDEPTEGECFLGGRDIIHCTDKQKAEIRNHDIGFIFQNFHLIQELTATENVKMALDIQNLYSKKKMSQKEMYTCSREILEKVGLKNEMDKKPSCLSGGQKQRVAIARALINRPKVILADEPTGALDQKTSMEIMSLFQKLNEEAHTIIVVTHDKNVAEKCKRIIRFEDGNII